jgi:hypothetical protein
VVEEWDRKIKQVWRRQCRGAGQGRTGQGRAGQVRAGVRGG